MTSPAEYTNAEVIAWLQTLPIGLSEEVASNFEAKDVTGAVMPSLTKEQLEQVGTSRHPLEDHSW
jgi:hypothetical protein